MYMYICDACVYRRVRAHVKGLTDIDHTHLFVYAKKLPLTLLCVCSYKNQLSHQSRT